MEVQHYRPEWYGLMREMYFKLETFRDPNHELFGTETLNAVSETMFEYLSQVKTIATNRHALIQAYKDILRVVEVFSGACLFDRIELREGSKDLFKNLPGEAQKTLFGSPIETEDEALTHFRRSMVLGLLWSQAGQARFIEGPTEISVANLIFENFLEDLRSNLARILPLKQSLRAKTTAVLQIVQAYRLYLEALERHG